MPNDDFDAILAEVERSDDFSLQPDRISDLSKKGSRISEEQIYRILLQMDNFYEFMAENINNEGREAFIRSLLSQRFSDKPYLDAMLSRASLLLKESGESYGAHNGGHCRLGPRRTLCLERTFQVRPRASHLGLTLDAYHPG
jgi:hypothetical protein